MLILKYKKLIVSIFFVGFIFLGLQSGIFNPKNEVNILSNKKNKNPILFSEIPVDYFSPLQYKLDVIHYLIDLELHPDEKKLKSSVEITGIFVDTVTSQIDLNFYDNFSISSVLLNGKEVEYINKGFRFSVFSKEELIDTFKLKITYEGTPKRSGLSGFVFGKINNKSLVYSINEPISASSWFPCNDLPSDKVLLDIIINNKSGMVSASNGKLISKNESGERSIYHWQTVYPISTYLIAVYSSEYAYYDEYYINEQNDSIKIEYYVLPEDLLKAKKDFEEHIQMMDFFTKTFGEYPFKKEKYGVAQFLWQMGAMEHQTITGIGSIFVTGNKLYNDVLVHELAHHWWGNAVGPATWNDIWLNEGFATYSEALYEEHINGKEGLRSSMRFKKGEFNDETLYAPTNNMFSSTIYEKGAWVLHMLRNEIGDSLFFNLLREYYETYKYKSATTFDFQKLAEEISNKKLTQFFNQWIYEGIGIPEIEYNYSIKEDENGYILLLEFKQLQKGYEVYDLNIPVEVLHIKNKDNFRLNINLNEKYKQFEIPLSIKPLTIKIDPDETLLMNTTLNKQL